MENQKLLETANQILQDGRAFVKHTAPQLWEMLIRQMMINGGIRLVIGTLLSVAIGYGLVFAVRGIRKDDDSLPGYSGLAFCLVFAALPTVVEGLIGGTMRLVIPEFYAFELLVGQTCK